MLTFTLTEQEANTVLTALAQPPVGHVPVIQKLQAQAQEQLKKDEPKPAKKK